MCRRVVQSGFGRGHLDLASPPPPPPQVYYRAARYIRDAYPFWNASGGADHVWAIARDAAACATPWGSLLEELGNATILSNWGGVTGLSGRVEERCYSPTKARPPPTSSSPPHPHLFLPPLSPPPRPPSPFKYAAVTRRWRRPSQDLVVPGTLPHAVVERSPLLLPDAEREAQLESRTTQACLSSALSAPRIAPSTDCA